ncbi:hypothetical protein GC194_14835 [bacterium]|nr:hypothetical protein [bacterium]
MKTKGKFIQLSRNEQIGFMVIAVLILLTLAAKAVIKQINMNSEPVDTALVATLERALAQNAAREKQVEDMAEMSFSFNPNRISYDSLLLLGFSENLAKRFINYRSAGNGFYNAEAVFKLYGLDSSLKKRIDTLMFFSKSAAQENDDTKPASNELATERASTFHNTKKPDYKNERKPFRKKEHLTIHLNRTDTSELQKIYGIGSALSERIINYRNMLGGFVRPTQFFEVYGVDSQKIDLKNVTLLADSQNVKKVAINELDADALAQLPYFNNKQSRVIVNYRNEHGDYQSYGDLLRTKVVSKEQLQQLIGYLQFE